MGVMEFMRFIIFFNHRGHGIMITTKQKLATCRPDRRLFAVALLCSFVLTGCGSAAYQSAPVDPSMARDTLTRVMESWREGESVDSLREELPPVVVQDFDWTGGMKLLDYELVGEGKPVDANLIAQVKLTLEDKQGTQSEKTVTYVVGTAPALTVFRDMFK
jgi:hypothetical protein